MVSTKMLIGYKPVLAETTRFHMMPPTKGKIAGGEGDLAMQGASEPIIIDFVSSYANQSSWVDKAACKPTKNRT
jgi:hypothetical protein